MEINKTDAVLLIVDDDEDILFTLKMLLKKHIQHIFTSQNPHHLPRLLRQHHPDLVLLDMNFNKGDKSGKDGINWLKKIKELNSEVEVIVITAHGDVQIAVSALKHGANDFIEKPWQNEKLLAMVQSALQISISKRRINHLEQTNQALSLQLNQPAQKIVGASESIRSVRQIIEKVAPTDANVLILGENGTGKELVARSIHASSNRSQEVFISVDLGAIPESLFESEMFGHKKGSFTGADEDRIGRIQAAHRGTLFLDEIANLSLTAQGKLLSALQNRMIVPVGANHPVPVDIRLICATNRSLSEMVAQQQFRQDLLYRLKTVEIEVPPLRERIGDVDLLSKHYLDFYKRKYRKSELELSEKAIAALNIHHWPGNIRELRHTIERAVILSEGPTLTDLDLHLQSPKMDALVDLDSDNLNLESMERKLVIRALQMHRGNVSKAATELGITRTSLYRRLNKYGL